MVRVWKNPERGNDTLRFQFNGDDGEIFELLPYQAELSEPVNPETGKPEGQVPGDWLELTHQDYNPDDDPLD